MVSSDRATELDLEVIPDRNVIRGLDKCDGEGTINPMSQTIESSSSNRSTLADTQRLLATLTGNGGGDGYLNERKFYVNGFEHLKAELTGAQSFWWDPNGSLRKVTISAFDDHMSIQRQMGILDLDETEAEKKRRVAEEERERMRAKKTEVSR